MDLLFFFQSCRCRIAQCINASRDPCRPMLWHRLFVSIFWWTVATNSLTTYSDQKRRKEFTSAECLRHEPCWSTSASVSSETGAPAEARTMCLLRSRLGFQNDATLFNVWFFRVFSAFFKNCAVQNLSVGLKCCFIVNYMYNTVTQFVFAISAIALWDKTLLLSLSLPTSMYISL